MDVFFKKNKLGAVEQSKEGCEVGQKAVNTGV
jgi:hypothetical protein